MMMDILPSISTVTLRSESCYTITTVLVTSLEMGNCCTGTFRWLLGGLLPRVQVSWLKFFHFLCPVSLVFTKYFIVVSRYLIYTFDSPIKMVTLNILPHLGEFIFPNAGFVHTMWENRCGGAGPGCCPQIRRFLTLNPAADILQKGNSRVIHLSRPQWGSWESSDLDSAIRSVEWTVGDEGHKSDPQRESWRFEAWQWSDRPRKESAPSHRV